MLLWLFMLQSKWIKMSDSNGLVVNEESFMCMKPKEQMCVLYQNTEELKKLVIGYKFHQKIQYILITAALAGLGILFKLKLGA